MTRETVEDLLAFLIAFACVMASVGVLAILPPSPWVLFAMCGLMIASASIAALTGLRMIRATARAVRRRGRRRDIERLERLYRLQPEDD